MPSTYNLSAAAQALMVDNTGLATLMAGATLTVYDGRQPLTADTATTSDNHSMATFSFTNAPLGIYGMVDIIVMDTMPDTIWSRAGTPSFVRATNGGTTIFDCSIGQQVAGLDQGPDIVIKQSPVRAGDLAHIENGTVERISHRRKSMLAADGIFG